MVGTFVLIQLGVFLILDWFFLGKVIMAGACDMPCWVNCSAIGFPSLHTTASSIWTSGLRGLPTWGLLGLLEMICLATLVGGWFLGFCTHVLCPTMPAGHGDFMPALSCDWCSVPLPGMNLSLFCAVRLCVYTLWGVGYTGSRNAFSFRMTPAAWTSHWPCRLSFALSWLLGAVVGLAWPVACAWACVSSPLTSEISSARPRSRRLCHAACVPCLFGTNVSSSVAPPRAVSSLRGLCVGCDRALGVCAKMSKVLGLLIRCGAASLALRLGLSSLPCTRFGSSATQTWALVSWSLALRTLLCRTRSRLLCPFVRGQCRSVTTACLS